MTSLAMALALISLVLVGPTFAIEVRPSEEMVAQTVEDGKKDAEKNRATTMNRFGVTSGTCSGFGFIQTKLFYIRSTSKVNARKMRPTSKKEIDSLLSAPAMEITYVLCTSSANQTDHHMVLQQGEQVIQPVKVVIPHSEVTASKSYVYTLMGVFTYGSFHPKAETTIIVIPEMGEKVEHRVKLSEYR